MQIRIQAQGKYICDKLLFSKGDFIQANLFLECLDLDPETSETFKKDYIFDNFFTIIEKQDINLFNKFYKIDDLKEETFQRLTSCKKIEYFFLESHKGTQFCFLNKILKWFLKTDKKVEEWKEHIISSIYNMHSPLITYDNPDWIDQLFKYLGCSYEKESDIKKELLFRAMHEIDKSTRDNEEFLPKNILVLCSYKNEKIIEFIDSLRAFYEYSIENRMCLLCMNNTLVHFSNNEDKVQLYCEYHSRDGFIYPYNVDDICSSFSKEIENLLSLHNET